MPGPVGVLNERQALAYTDLADIWNPTQPTGYNTDGTAKDVIYQQEYYGESCKFFTREEEALATAIGRTSRYTRMTMEEIFRFPANIVLMDGAQIVLKTPGHPLYGQAFLSLGKGAMRGTYGTRDPNLVETPVKRTKKGSGVS